MAPPVAVVGSELAQAPLGRFGDLRRIPAVGKPDHTPGAHHQRLHAGFLLVEGDAEGELTFRHADGAVYGSGGDAQVVSVQGAAYGALRQLGFRETESKEALARVRSRGASLHPTGCAGLDASLELVIRLALAELTRQ